MNLETILNTAPVIPVIIIEDLAQAVPLARALVAGGLKVIEITLRTAQGLDAIRAVAGEVPEAIVGVGTIVEPAQLTAAAKAGARFAVSPGITSNILDAAETGGIPLLPGIATVSEALALIERGYSYAKFFPAAPAGGAPFLSAISSPLPQLTFCPTGGISLDSAPDYLKLPNVICIGGSWIATRADIAAGDWPAITARAVKAAALNEFRRS
jgi:2-dehydro-3-deoxyphosphogluconate aldolase/(4S)-4-hydroxy-2-oxoglutarate aldolase